MIAQFQKCRASSLNFWFVLIVDEVRGEVDLENYSRWSPQMFSIATKFKQFLSILSMEKSFLRQLQA